MSKLSRKIADFLLENTMRVCAVITYLAIMVTLIAGIVLLFAGLGWFVSQLNFMGI